MEGLISGRVVHYVMTGKENGLMPHVSGQHRAATVVRCWGDEPREGYVNLVVHVDGYNDLIQTDDVSVSALIPQVWVTGVFHDEGEAPGTWHWPDRS